MKNVCTQSIGLGDGWRGSVGTRFARSAVYALHMDEKPIADTYTHTHSLLFLAHDRNAL